MKFLGGLIFVIVGMTLFFGLLDYMMLAGKRLQHEKICEAIRWSHPICNSKIE